jgi:5-hydroxyisourate hydrolase
MATISTHVLDLESGNPAPNLAVTLERMEDGAWRRVHAANTDPDGRVADLLGESTLRTGVYRLVFNTAAYGHRFYPEVTVAFRVEDAARHHHIPLLLSPYGYSTYRGS